MKNKTAVITGGTSGIGWQTAKALAEKGCRIFLIGRNKEKAQAAVEQIREQSGNKEVHYVLADLSSQKSIRQAAARLNGELNDLDILINNAGGVFPDFTQSADGLEMTIATNHFAYFLLTRLLLPKLRQADAGRIINVASRSHYKGKIDFESFTQNKGYFILKAYAQSKLANVLFTQELAEHLQGTALTVNSLHPGFVKTDIGNKGTPWYARLVWTLGTGLSGISPEQGAATSIYLATADEVKNLSGKYFDHCRLKEPAAEAHNKALQKELWRVSEQLCPLG